MVCNQSFPPRSDKQQNKNRRGSRMSKLLMLSRINSKEYLTIAIQNRLYWILDSSHLHLRRIQPCIQPSPFLWSGLYSLLQLHTIFLPSKASPPRYPYTIHPHAYTVLIRVPIQPLLLDAGNDRFLPTLPCLLTLIVT